MRLTQVDNTVSSSAAQFGLVRERNAGCVQRETGRLLQCPRLT